MRTSLMTAWLAALRAARAGVRSLAGPYTSLPPGSRVSLSPITLPTAAMVSALTLPGLPETATSRDAEDHD